MFVAKLWILGLQALLFLVPHIIWRQLNWKSGINVRHVVEEASELQKKGSEARQPELVKLAAYIQGSLHMRFHYRRALNKNQISRGLFLVFLYMFMKTLNLLIAIAQILQAFLDRIDSFYGWKLLTTGGNGTVGLFPRVTYCDFAIRIIGNKFQRYTMQCVLGINMINEKLFGFLWFWVLIVAIVSIISLCSWLDRVFFPFSRYNFISSYLESAPGWMEREEKALIEEVSPDRRASKLKHRVYSFVYSFLGQDGVFLLRLVAWNAGIGVTSALVDTLYQDFRLVKADAKQEDREEETTKLPIETKV